MKRHTFKNKLLEKESLNIKVEFKNPYPPHRMIREHYKFEIDEIGVKAYEDGELEFSFDHKDYRYNLDYMLNHVYFIYRALLRRKVSEKNRRKNNWFAL